MVDVTTDIDIDFLDREKALEGLSYVSGTIEQRGHRVKHASGVYFQDIPVDPISKTAAYLYEEAESLGYFKIDFLNNSIYAGVRDEDHLEQLMREPPWELFESPEIVSMLSQIHSSFNIVNTIKPKSFMDLAVILALIRPGKRHLLSHPRHEIDADIWTKGSDEYFFKKSHAVAFAVSIGVQLNLIIEQTGQDVDAENMLYG
jgi:hypothetical protein